MTTPNHVVSMASPPIRARNSVPPSVPVQRKQYQSYTIKDGDTLATIAKQFYGSSNQWAKIYNANLTRIKNPSNVRAGQVIVIP